MNGVTRRVGDLFKRHKNIIMMKAMRMLLDVTRDRAEIGLYKKNDDDDDVDGMVDSARVA